MRNVALALIVLFATAAPCLAGNGNGNANCTVAGTWYGGSPDAGSLYYQTTFTPVTPTNFSSRWQYNPEIASLGCLHATDWSGDISRSRPGEFKGYIMSMYQWDPVSPLLPPGVDPALPEMDFIPYSIDFLDCNTFQGTIRHWYVYYNFTNDITPLSKNSRPPDLVMDFDPPIIEVYHRAPNSCPGCPFASVSSSCANVQIG